MLRHAGHLMKFYFMGGKKQPYYYENKQVQPISAVGPLRWSWNIPATIPWIALTCCTGIHGFQRMCPINFDD